MTRGNSCFDPASSLSGVIAPTVLPLTPAGELDLQSFRRLLEYLLLGGVDGLWVNGTTGEFFALTDEEQARAIQCAVEQARRRVPVIAQVGDASTRRAIAKATQACAAGADFLSILLPFYLDYTEPELQRYLEAVSKAVQRPLVLYQMPQTCKVALSVHGIVELARDGVLLGIKDSSGNLEFYGRLAAQVREEGLSFQLLNGSSMLMDASLLVGGHGVVSGISNLTPHLCRKLYQLAQRREWAAVAALQEQISALVQALRLPKQANIASVITAYKWTLRELGILTHDYAFAPSEPLDQSATMFLREGALPLAQDMSKDLLAAFRKMPGDGKETPRFSGSRKEASGSRKADRSTLPDRP
jgi:4-hydroxy-tetrahydrodipicolinate synthase